MMTMLVGLASISMLTITMTLVVSRARNKVAFRIWLESFAGGGNLQSIDDRSTRLERRLDFSLYGWLWKCWKSQDIRKNLSMAEAWWNGAIDKLLRTRRGRPRVESPTEIISA